MKSVKLDDPQYRPGLGVNIDHVATVRNARGGVHPQPLRAAQLALNLGVRCITAHLREDRRHITDHDIAEFSQLPGIILNLEAAVTPEMLEIALRHTPHSVCFVPEKREERTTEGGLNVADQVSTLIPYVQALKEKNILVGLFIAPRPEQIQAAVAVGADIVEFHTGDYCNLYEAGETEKADHALKELASACIAAHRAGLRVHGGHGLNFETAELVAALPYMQELNIGHFLIGEAIFFGLAPVIERMKSSLDKGFSRRAEL
jgi:pyridoxine 5-phosphate synthase